MFKDFDERYTPRTINDIVFHSQDAREVIKDCVSGALGFPASGKNGILLYGVNGTGKSALAKLLPDLFEFSFGNEQANFATYVNISQGGDNGAKIIESIKHKAILIPYCNRYNYYVLDEVDNLRIEAMDSLKAAMNIASFQNVFILTTNKLSAVERGVQDRCIRIEFNAAPATAWLDKFKQVLCDYGVTHVTDTDALRIIEMCNGSAREIMLAARQLVVRHYRKNGMPLKLAA